MCHLSHLPHLRCFSYAYQPLRRQIADIVTFLACIYLSIVLLFCNQFATYQLTLVLYWTPLEDRLDCASDESNSLSAFFRNHFRSRRDELEWESSCMAQDPEWHSDLAAIPVYAALIALPEDCAPSEVLDAPEEHCSLLLIDSSGAVGKRGY